MCAQVFAMHDCEGSVRLLFCFGQGDGEGTDDDCAFSLERMQVKQ